MPAEAFTSEVGFWEAGRLWRRLATSADPEAPDTSCLPARPSDFAHPATTRGGAGSLPSRCAGRSLSRTALLGRRRGWSVRKARGMESGGVVARLIDAACGTSLAVLAAAWGEARPGPSLERTSGRGPAGQPHDGGKP